MPCADYIRRTEGRFGNDAGIFVICTLEATFIEQSASSLNSLYSLSDFGFCYA